MNTDQHETNLQQQHNVSRTAPRMMLKEKVTRSAYVALGVFLVLVLIGFFASRSIPGDVLYGVKTGFLEKINEAVQFTDEGRAQSQIEHMKTRLAELKVLTQKGAQTEEDTRFFSDLVTKHKDTLFAIADTEELTHTQKITALEDFAGIAAAMETIAEHDADLSALGEFLEDVRRETVNTYKDKVDRFVESQTQADIYEFIKERLTHVSGELGSGDLSEDTINDAETYINRVGSAMAESNYPRAITAIAEALRFIQIERYGALEFTKTTPETDSDTATTTQGIEAESPAGTGTAPFTFPE